MPDENPKVIYLAPICEHGEEGRMWCQDDVWECECGADPKHEAVKYIRADAKD